jgi:hypothetical protein
VPVRFFVSHVTSEAPVASTIAGWLQAAGAEAYVASDDIAAGELWLESLHRALASADIVLVLASRRSLERNWVWFEAGSAWASSGRRCIPVCFEPQLRKEQLPPPLASLQAIDIATNGGMKALFELAGVQVPPEEIRRKSAELKDAVARASLVNPRTARVLDPPAGAGVLIDTSHGQASWPLGGLAPTLLADLDTIRSAFEIADHITVERIEHPDQIWRHDLAAWPGLVVALPYRTRFGTHAVREIEEWVRAGGRLLLLGFELGDRHHESNLNELAERFGIRFNSDIVAPRVKYEGKPYNQAVDVARGESADALLSGLSSTRVWNAQSISTEPGGRPFISLAELGIAHLTDESTRYNDGGWHIPADQKFKTSPAPPDRHLAAFAPSDLAGLGQVLAFGTWQLRSDSTETKQLVNRLVGWLSAPRAHRDGSELARLRS